MFLQIHPGEAILCLAGAPVLRTGLELYQEDSHMKIAICCYSRHHGNTRKVLEAMARDRDVDLIDVTAQTAFDPRQYDVIGFASGIYYGKFHETVLNFARQYLPPRTRTFFVYTSGSSGKNAAASIRKIAAEKNAVILGEFGCKGYDTFGPFKLIGGIAKHHPNEAELKEARAFFERAVLEI